MGRYTVNKQLLPMKAHYFLYNAGTGPVVPYLSSYARQLGFSSVTVGFIYTILPISGMLAKPLFGSIADRFKCQKLLFLLAQLLTAVTFLAIYYSPQVSVERQVHFSCFDNLAAFNTLSEASLSSCNFDQIQNEDVVDNCKIISYYWTCNVDIVGNTFKSSNVWSMSSLKSYMVEKFSLDNRKFRLFVSKTDHMVFEKLMTCEVNPRVSNVFCQDWQLENFCNSSDVPNTYTFDVDVPKTKMDLLNSTIIFMIDRIRLTNGTTVESVCNQGRNLSTHCTINCNDFSVNDLIAKPAISDDQVYDIYEFWVFLILMITGWVGQAIIVSIGDAICFEMLGDKPNRYGNQRLFGALGWGLISALAGFIIDALSQGRSEKNYVVAFYMAAGFMLLDFIVSSRIKHSQKKISSNIFRDVGRLLLNVRIDVYLVWCITVGMCTGLIWQFLFWLIEDLATAQGCDMISYVKSLQGIIQAIQCLLGEVPFFFLSGWIIKKIGHVHTMSLVLFALGIRLTLYSVISNPWFFLPVELLNGLTFGLFFACMASYASIIAPPGTEATMQGLVGAVFEGIGVSAGSALAGLSYKVFKGPLTFRYFGFGSLIMCFVHIVVQYILKAKDTKPEYTAPNDALEKIQQEDQQELTYVDS